MFDIYDLYKNIHINYRNIHSWYHIQKTKPTTETPIQYLTSSKSIMHLTWMSIFQLMDSQQFYPNYPILILQQVIKKNHRHPRQVDNCLPIYSEKKKYLF
jgi:hypothetical protein